jgi:hypothetical protein
MNSFTEKERMVMAHQIANAAVHLDEITSNLPSSYAKFMIQKDIDDSKAHATKLHNIAEILAGSRLSELYGAPEYTQKDQPQEMPS